MVLFVLLAQAPDPISGGAGWIGAGLLGAVLAWLLGIHLPAKDKQLKEFMEVKDEQIANLTEKYENKLVLVTSTFEKESDANRTDFRRTLDVVMNHCTEESKKILEAFRSEIARSEELRVRARTPNG